jgi:NAD(P)-dependent dehydrogenase (short-subunit alcohol dehydrogenase family)
MKNLEKGFMMLNKIRNKLRYKQYVPLTYSEELREAYLGGSVTGGQLKGKKILITGATGGIGISLCLRYIDEGCKVFMAGRNRKKLDEAMKYILEKRPNGEIKDVCFDLIDETEVKKSLDLLYSKENGIDVLICNAGFFDDMDRKATFIEYPNDMFKLSWKTNYLGNQVVCDTVLELMKKRGMGKVIIMSSICAQQKKTQYTPYGMTKSALTKYAMLLQDKYPQIDIITIFPGSVATKMAEKYIGSDISCGCNVINRVILPEEISAIAAFLCSDNSRYLKGKGIVASACQIF